ncbi:dihydroorotase family protein [Candidatus Berkelbacteria bacterium]|nr:dihydroorotase family protein [Candidatus Berkelbacteria bacterium]
MTASRMKILRGGIVPTKEGNVVRDIAIQDGKIVRVGEAIASALGSEDINVSNMYVVPGFIDGHVHLREMGHSDREDYVTGTQAAAVGGITTVLDMPNSKPNVITPDDFMARRDRIHGRAYVNIGLYVWACAKNVERLHEFKDLGAVAFKVFTAESGAYDPTFSQYVTTQTEVMARILESVGEFNGLTAIHSESQALIGKYEEEAKKMAPDMKAWLHSRPQVVEDVAVFGEVAIARHANARIHICHVVGKGAVDFVRWAKSNYYPNVSCEVAPHNLLMNAEQATEMGSVAKFSPPVHGEEARGALWEGLVDGTIDMVGSDHAPQHYEKKHNPNIWEASPGSPALDYWVPLMLDQVAAGRLTMHRLVEVASERPARIFGLYPRKGSLQVGSDADLVVIDINKTSVVDPGKFKSKGKYTPFAGWTMRGIPVMTFVNGTVVAKNGEITSEPGAGTMAVPV